MQCNFITQPQFLTFLSVIVNEHNEHYITTKFIQEITQEVKNVQAVWNPCARELPVTFRGSVSHIGEARENVDVTRAVVVEPATPAWHGGGRGSVVEVIAAVSGGSRQTERGGEHMPAATTAAATAHEARETTKRK